MSITVSAQNPDRIRFGYDSAGNQILRTLCLGCDDSRQSNENVKEFSDLEDDDLLKFNPGDLISYYPNPVKEQLYLNWKVLGDNYVKSIKIFSSNGQLLNTIESSKLESSKIISFNNYPVGNYFILIIYSNNENTSITIIKK
ncbi:T9SS type A sorting domain-containing protein [Flavobacterium sp. U410]